MKPIKIISDELNKAFNSGLFNNIWFFIKDFKNYKLQFFVEYNQNEKEEAQNFIIGELNSLGFKDINGNYHSMYFERAAVNKNDKVVPPKYYIKVIGEEKWNDLPTENPLVIESGTFKPTSFELLPFAQHTEKKEFVVDLPIELLYKIEETITIEIEHNKQLKDFIFGLFLTFAFHTEFKYESNFRFVSVIRYDKDNSFPNTFFGFDTFDFFSEIKPIHYEIIKEANKLLSTRKISDKVSSLSKTFLDDLLEIEEKEEREIGLGLIFKEYHRLIERLGNYIYENLCNQIQTVVNLFPTNYNTNLALNRLYLKRIFIESQA